MKALVKRRFGTYRDHDGTIEQNPPPDGWKRPTVGNAWAASPGTNGKHEGNPVGASVQASEDPVPVPIPEWPDPPEGAAFHEIAGQIVKLIAPSTEADPVGLLLQLLAGFGNAVGHGRLG